MSCFSRTSSPAALLSQRVKPLSARTVAAAEADTKLQIPAPAPMKTPNPRNNIADALSVDTTCHLVSAHVLLRLPHGSPHGKVSLAVSLDLLVVRQITVKKAIKGDLLGGSAADQPRNAHRIQADTRTGGFKRPRPTIAEQTEHRDAM